MWATILLWFTLFLMAFISFLMGIVLLKLVKLDKNEWRLVFSMSVFAALWGNGYVFMAISETVKGAAIGRAVSIFGEYAFLMAALWFFEIYCKCYNLKKCIMLIIDTILAVCCAVLSVLPGMVTFVHTRWGMSFYSHEGYVRVFKIAFIMLNAVIVCSVFYKGLRNLKFKRQRTINRSFAFMGVLILTSAFVDEQIASEERIFSPVSCIGLFIFMYALHVMGFKRNAFSITRGNVSKYTIESVRMPILVLDENGTVTMVNSYAKEFFDEKFERDNIKLHDLFMISSMDSELYIENVLSGLQTDSSRFIAKNNSTVCEVTPTVILDKYDEEICTMIFITDMTKEYKLVEKLRNTKTALELELKEKNKQVEMMAAQTVSAVASFIDSKEPYTVGHSSRVAAYARNIAKELGWDDAEVRNIYYVGLLHDIGKIGIPHSILSKPSKLTDEEYEQIKKHPVIGGEILNNIKSIKNVSIGAFYHHERYDGKGYPNGLKGEEIPLIARIIGIADAYDAMTSNRKYRKHLGIDLVKKEIQNGAGTQFDPYIASVVIRMMEEGSMMIDENAETDVNTSVQNTDVIHETNQLMAKLFDNEVEPDNDKFRDKKTGLLTREAGKKVISDYLRIGDGALILVEVDHFQNVNDSYGELSGENVIREVADILRAYEQTDFVCRYGENSFIIFIKDAVDSHMIKVTLETIMYTYNCRAEKNILLMHTSLTMGVAMSHLESRRFEDLYSCADKAVYYLKQNSKCGYCFYNGNSTTNLSDFEQNNLNLPRIVNIIKKRDIIPGAYKVEFRQFLRVHDFIEKYAKRNNQQIQLILLSINYRQMWNTSEEKRNDIATKLEDAVSSSLRGVDVCTKFSNSQMLITLVDTSESNVDPVMNRVLQNFYKIYGKEDIKIEYEAQNITMQAS